ncbi:pseudouridine synthase [Crepidotus variabilis]|uniref:Pseudouridine synthase n=1 Tax=Crepidotus variabilis TaxID=179855 RepID=A0A9P6E4S2_9AGAR|nr:pseudouridine synthase [Crepidotus variabilis]
MNLGVRFLSTRSSISRFGIPMAATSTSSIAPSPYMGWTREQLIERLTQLEGTTSELQEGQDATVGSVAAGLKLATPSPEVKQTRKFDFAKHARRKVAIKFCYSGWEYSGLAFQQGATPLPTVENVLFDAMAKAHLVDPAGGFDGCGWERCGRTDRGVSGAGQVVSLWIRSQIHQQTVVEAASVPFSSAEPQEAREEEPPADGWGALTLEPESTNSSVSSANGKAKQVQEFNYLVMLNRLLPDTVRAIAWSPVSDTFSARFSCKYRHYKYFFSSLHLDISRMQAGADRLLGEHDFRNLCKLDVQKQITSFKRKILQASITPLEGEDDGHGRMYVFDLVGTAFLYHQVRHIMAALFLVGSGLESPERITELMNVAEGAEPLHEQDASTSKTYMVVGSKPDYQMADGLPLMLWDCGYDKAELDWRTTGQAGVKNDSLQGDLYHQLEGIYTRSRVYSALDQHFLKAVEKHYPRPAPLLPLNVGSGEVKARLSSERVINVPLGGGTFKRLQKYKPLLEKKRLDTVEVMNERWRLGKGMRRDEKKKVAEGGAVDDGNE